MVHIAYRPSDRRPWIFWLSFFWLAAAMLVVPTVQADIYFWQDEQGVIHFSNQDAPPAATLYMREPAPVVAPPSPESVDSPRVDHDELAAKLEKANRRLERALERVDELTDKVKDSEQAAAAAAATAQQAARQINDNTVQAEPEPTYAERPRVVYYAAPYVRHPVKYGKGYRTPPHDPKYRTPPHHPKYRGNHSPTHRTHYRRDGIKAKHPARITHHGKFRRSANHRHRSHVHHQKKWPVPHRTWIPKAYGVR